MPFDQLGRREFISLLGGAAAWPLAARAQQPNQIARVGYLSQESTAFDRSHGDSAAFRDALGDLGYVEGRNLHIEFRYADADLDRLPTLAAELVGLNVDIIVTYSVGTFAARRVTTTIPIVQAVGGDLVCGGLRQESRSSWWERHGIDLFPFGADGKAIGVAQGNPAIDDARGRARGSKSPVGAGHPGSDGEHRPGAERDHPTNRGW